MLHRVASGNPRALAPCCDALRAAIDRNRDVGIAHPGGFHTVPKGFSDFHALTVAQALRERNPLRHFLQGVCSARE